MKNSDFQVGAFDFFMKLRENDNTMLREQMRSESGFSPEQKHETKYSILKDEYGREALLERMDEFIDQVRDEKPDFLIFLDKSARPLAWLFKERFKNRFPGEESPEIRFMNIGSEKNKTKWDVIKSDSEAEKEDNIYEKIKNHEAFTYREMPESWKNAGVNENQIQNLREIFGEQFDGKTVTVVDEISSSGRSMGTAMGYLNNAFPKIKTSAESLFNQNEIRSNSNSDLMPWFQQPGLIGVFDVMSEDQILAKRLDKTSIEFAKSYVNEKKNSTLNNLQHFFETNDKEIKNTTDLLETLLKKYKVDLRIPDQIKSHLDWVTKEIGVIQNDESSKYDIDTSLSHIYEPIYQTDKTLEEMIKIVSDKNELAMLKRAITLFNEFIIKYQDAEQAVIKSIEFNKIEEGFGQAKILREELKKLAKEHSEGLVLDESAAA